ncbi:EpsG family protein [Lysobacter sp. A289]
MGIFVIVAVLVLLSWSAAICLRPNSYIAGAGKANSLVLSAFVAFPLLMIGVAMAGLRPETAGFDTARYIFTYQRISSSLTAIEDGALYYGNTEFLWWPIQSFLRNLLDAKAWLLVNFLFVIAASAVCYKVVARTYRLNFLIFSLAFATFFVVYAGNGMRQALAVPVGALGFFYFFNRRYILWAVCSVLAVGLHWSALAVFLVTVFRCNAFNRDYLYVLLPAFCLAASVLMADLVGMVVDFVGFGGFSEKYDLYFSGTRESHVGAVWKTLNFWLCSVLSLAYLIFCKRSLSPSASLHSYVVVFLSLVFFGIRIPDFSERYFPYLLFVTPLIVALLIDRLPFSARLKNVSLLVSFFLLAVMVYANESTQATLGYSLS